MTARLGSRGTGQAGQPTWWASVAVRSAALPLPSEHRWRYRQEFLAELHGMTPAEQRHHASGVLSRVWTLRAALSEPARLTPKEATMAKPWRCRIGRHRWQRLRGPDGRTRATRHGQAPKGGGRGLRRRRPPGRDHGECSNWDHAPATASRLYQSSDMTVAVQFATGMSPSARMDVWFDVQEEAVGDDY